MLHTIVISLTAKSTRTDRAMQLNDVASHFQKLFLNI